VHDPPGLEVRDDLFDDVADLVDLLIELLLPTQEVNIQAPRLTAAAGDRRLRFGGGCGVDVVAVRRFRNDRGLCPARGKSLPWIRVMR
jgi:hypothetical protein